jgi:hypothetical protein
MPAMTMPPLAARERSGASGESWSLERTARLPMPVDADVFRSEPPAAAPEASTGEPYGEGPHVERPDAERPDAQGRYPTVLSIAAETSPLAPDAGSAVADPFPTPVIDPFPTPASASGWPAGEEEAAEPGHPAGAKRSRRPLRVAGVVAILGAVAGVVFYVVSSDPKALWRTQGAPSATIAGSSSSPILSAATSAPAAPMGDESPPAAEMAGGFGFLEALVPAGALVQVDDAAVGVGPRTGNALSPGYHELTVEQAGRKSTQVVEVRAGKTTRVRVALP